MNSVAAGTTPVVTHCATCGTEIVAGILACPGCLALVHSEQLKTLFEQATAASRGADRDAELAAWNSALGLLPIRSRQHTIVAAKIAGLSAGPDINATATPQPQSRFWKWMVGLGPVGILVWKLKFLAVALLMNGKVLLLGLTKASTFLSMLLAFGVYWTAWGMWFALGLVISIYIHEMGHVVALRRYGIAATAPMFVPGLGAFIRLRQASLPPLQNARVGLAGPVWGLGAASASWAMSKLGGGPMWAAIAHTERGSTSSIFCPFGSSMAIGGSRRWGACIGGRSAAHSASHGLSRATGCSRCWQSLRQYVRSIRAHRTSPTSACGRNSCS